MSNTDEKIHTDSLDINDQNELDYEEDDQINSSKTKFSNEIKPEEDSDGEIKSEPDDGEVVCFLDLDK